MTNSPDLSPLDFFLWRHLKDLVYKSLQDSLAEIIISIRREIWTISTETCAAVVRNFRRRLYVLIDQGAPNLEHILWLLFFLNRLILKKKNMHFCEICIVKFTLHTFIKMHLLFCSINSKSKWYYGTPCMLELTALLFRRQGNTLRT